MAGQPAVAVVGSINLDLVARCERLPRAGETLTDATFERVPGGKGANQALAAARLGAAVSIAGAVGEDPFADEALALLREGGVDLSGVQRVVEPTGVALILVGRDGRTRSSLRRERTGTLRQALSERPTRFCASSRSRSRLWRMRHGRLGSSA